MSHTKLVEMFHALFHILYKNKSAVTARGFAIEYYEDPNSPNFKDKDVELVWAVARGLREVMDRPHRQMGFRRIVEEIGWELPRGINPSEDDIRAALQALVHQGHLINWSVGRFPWSGRRLVKVYWLNPRGLELLDFLAELDKVICGVCLV